MILKTRNIQISTISDISQILEETRNRFSSETKYIRDNLFSLVYVYIDVSDSVAL